MKSVKQSTSKVKTPSSLVKAQQIFDRLNKNTDAAMQVLEGLIVQKAMKFGDTIKGKDETKENKQFDVWLSQYRVGLFVVVFLSFSQF